MGNLVIRIHDIGSSKNDVRRSFPFGMIISEGLCKVCFAGWYRIAADDEQEEEEEEEVFE